MNLFDSKVLPSFPETQKYADALVSKPANMQFGEFAQHLDVAIAANMVSGNYSTVITLFAGAQFFGNGFKGDTAQVLGMVKKDSGAAGKQAKVVPLNYNAKVTELLAKVNTDRRKALREIDEETGLPKWQVAFRAGVEKVMAKKWSGAKKAKKIADPEKATASWIKAMMDNGISRTGANTLASIQWEKEVAKRAAAELKAA